jgi:hypothetical protein
VPPLTRRTWLALAAWPAVAQSNESTATVPPDLGPRLNALWKQARSGPDAVLVSNVAYQELPPLRGWRDDRFLTAYLAWSRRAESLALHDNRLSADLGTYDAILLRWPYSPGIANTSAGPDPIGYTLIQPGAGNHHIDLHRAPGQPTAAQSPLAGLSTKPLPTVEAAVFSGKNIVTLWGTGFEGTRFEVASESGPGKILYTSLNQVNVELPTIDRVQLTIDGSPSLWTPVTR